ncbi:MAG: hypothetical protein GY719_04265 [bacterium]|nr:hypothetical protein [bacterium]
MNTEDPTIDRIRQVRHEISEEAGHDPRKLVAHYIKYQEQFGDRLLREPQKQRLKRTAKAGGGSLEVRSGPRSRAD